MRTEYKSRDTVSREKQKNILKNFRQFAKKFSNVQCEVVTNRNQSRNG